MGLGGTGTRSDQVTYHKGGEKTSRDDAAIRRRHRSLTAVVQQLPGNSAAEGLSSGGTATAATRRNLSDLDSASRLTLDGQVAGVGLSRCNACCSTDTAIF